MLNDNLGLIAIASPTVVSISFCISFLYFWFTAMAAPSQSIPSPTQTVTSPAFSSSPTTASTLFSNFNYKITEKLYDKNHLVWLQQIKPVLRARRLHCYGVEPQIPVQYLSEVDRLADVENPAYTAWELQDYLLLSWLQASLSTFVLSELIGCRHSWQHSERISQHFHS